MWVFSGVEAGRLQSLVCVHDLISGLVGRQTGVCVLSTNNLLSGLIGRQTLSLVCVH